MDPRETLRSFTWGREFVALAKCVFGHFGFFV